MFVCRLESDKDAEAQLRILSKIQERCAVEAADQRVKRLLNVCLDTAMAEEHSITVNVLLRMKQQLCTMQLQDLQVHAAIVERLAIKLDTVEEQRRLSPGDGSQMSRRRK